ncbi:hypothetical protein TNIN_280071 [Trichonephila inaurata madagascariensis]|uniref:Uncharacterized protein n=1 Tax=Trichonephila inaurata madagascariensis TaxID=2747483 RepID=A0A8X6XJ88_9ARAC|nr:hypothetical protein TNIN_280071 [Trichonephila inaurata madagascariensis]
MESEIAPLRLFRFEIETSQLPVQIPTLGAILKLQYLPSSHYLFQTLLLENVVQNLRYEMHVDVFRIKMATNHVYRGQRMLISIGEGTRIF